MTGIKVLFEGLDMQSILADVAVSVSELKKNPSGVLADAGGMPVAVLNHNRVIALKRAHVQLTCGGGALWPMGNTVDHERTSATDTFATVVIEGYRFFLVVDELLIELVEHF